jgi:hypothetical protein
LSHDDCGSGSEAKAAGNYGKIKWVQTKSHINPIFKYSCTGDKYYNLMEFLNLANVFDTFCGFNNNVG